jgi:hypothetical protein
VRKLGITLVPTTASAPFFRKTLRVIDIYRSVLLNPKPTSRHEWARIERIRKLPKSPRLPKNAKIENRSPLFSVPPCLRGENCLSNSADLGNSLIRSIRVYPWQGFSFIAAEIPASP